MKGFKKDGKFRPTEKKSKSSLKKSDVRKKKTLPKTGNAPRGEFQMESTKARGKLPSSRFGSKPYYGDEIELNRKLNKEQSQIGRADRGRDKKTLEKGKDYHLFPIYQSDGNDRQQIAVVKAKDLEEATEYVKNEYLTEEGREQVNEDGDGESTYLTVYDDIEDDIRDEIRNEMKDYGYNELKDIADEYGLMYDDPAFHEDDEGITKSKLDKIEKKMIKDLREEILEIKVEEELDMGETPHTTFEIYEDDDSEESFHTIYGSNDFVDLLEPENSGKKFSDVVKEKGGVEKAFFSASGQGFESGNPDNDFNLNLKHGEKLDLYEPDKNPHPTGRKK